MAFTYTFGPGIEKAYDLSHTERLFRECLGSLEDLSSFNSLPEYNQLFLGSAARMMIYLMRESAGIGWRPNNQFWGLYLVGSRAGGATPPDPKSDIDILSVGNMPQRMLEMFRTWSLGVHLNDPFMHLKGRLGYITDEPQNDDERLAKYVRSFFGESEYPRSSLRRLSIAGEHALSMDLISRGYDRAEGFCKEDFCEIDDQLHRPRVPLIEVTVNPTK